MLAIAAADRHSQLSPYSVPDRLGLQSNSDLPPPSPCMDTSVATGAGAAASASASQVQAQAQAQAQAQSHGNGGPASSMSPNSPVSVRSQVLAHGPGVGANGGPKRKRSSVGMMGSSPGSQDGDDDMMGDHGEKKRQPGVKRACNECRQQKVRQQSLLCCTHLQIQSLFHPSRTCLLGRLTVD